MNNQKVKYPCVILAGGKSSRMYYENKAFIKIKNHTLISRIIKKISNNNLPIAINANEHLDKFSKFGLEIIEDSKALHRLCWQRGALDSKRANRCPFILFFRTGRLK